MARRETGWSLLFVRCRGVGVLVESDAVLRDVMEVGVTAEDETLDASLMFTLSLRDVELSTI